MLNINDIKPLVQIPDYSIYFYYALILLGILLSIFIFYFIYLYIKKRRNSQHKEYYKILQNIQFSNPKQDAYTITFYGRLLATEPRSKQLMEELWHSLKQYKYKKNTPQTFSQETKAKFETFMDSLDV